MQCKVALSPRASLPLRGSIAVALFRLGAAMCQAAPDLPFAGNLSVMRGPCAVVCGRGWIGCSRVPSMESSRDALTKLRGEGLSGREL